MTTDEMRKIADEIYTWFFGREEPGQNVDIGDAATIALLEAADTIDQLRRDLVQAHKERDEKRRCDQDPIHEL